MRTLAIKEMANDLPRVDAKNPWNASGLSLEAGQTYRFQVEDVQDWRDASIVSSPEQGHLQPHWLLETSFAKRFRRFKEANWYTLIGSIGKDPSTFFFIGGGGRTYTPPVSGELFTFANDAGGPFYLFYRNNHGTLRLKITRLA